MSHAVTVPIALGASGSGLTLTAALLNPDGTAAAGLSTTALVEVGAGTGLYAWTGQIPDGFRGFVSFAAGGAVRALAGISPEESENADVRTSTRAAAGSGGGSGSGGGGAGLAPASALLQVLTPTDYDAVRHAIDVSLDANVLPNSVIEESVYGPAAESEVLARDLAALSYEATNASNWARVTRAVVLITAARLCVAMPNLTAEQLGDYRMSLKEQDWAERARTLRGMADRELVSYLQPAGRRSALPAFALATAKRGQ